MTRKYVIVRCKDGAFLGNDFMTWTTNRAEAHEFIDGAALNSCFECTRGVAVTRFADGDCKP